jgi:ribosome maturation factor RimP
MSSVVPHIESSSLWDAIRQIAVEQGVELFDLDMPGSAGGGVLRVYITRPKPPAGAAEEPPAGAAEESPGGAAEVQSAEAPPTEEAEGSPQRTGVSFEDCTRVSKRILDVDEETGLIPEGCLLEVSSPGVNRRLRRAEHFEGAVGERVRVKYRGSDSVYRVVTGMLKEARGDSMMIEAEEGKEMVSCRLGDVKEARVDFKF